MNKIEEKSIFNRFQDNFPNFPSGEISQPDKPDFVVEGSKKIGIEITQIFSDQQLEVGSKLKAQETRQRQLGENIINGLKQYELKSLIIDVGINHTIGLIKSNIRHIANECIPHIINEYHHLENLDTYTIINYGQLPHEISQIFLLKNNAMEELQFVESGGAVLRELISDDIQFLLDKKNNDLLGYQYCDEYWLVIKEGSYIADSFSNINVDAQILDSQFQKIFVIRQFNSQIIRIK
jgi:hypothetical protein